MALTFFRAKWHPVGLDTTLTVTGTVYARPRVEPGEAIPVTPATPPPGQPIPTTNEILPTLKSGTIVNGVLTDSGDNLEGIKLIANVGIGEPAGLRYEFTFVNFVVGTEKIQIPPFMAFAPGDGSDLDLATSHPALRNWGWWTGWAGYPPGWGQP